MTFDELPKGGCPEGSSNKKSSKGDGQITAQKARNKICKKLYANAKIPFSRTNARERKPRVRQRPKE